MARALVDVVNGGKLAAQREFVRARFSLKGLEEVPLEDGAAFLQRMWTQSGGIDVVDGPPARAPNLIAFTVRSRRGRHFARINLVPDTTGDHIDAVFCQPVPDPKTVRKPGIAAAPMSEEEIMRAVTGRAEELAALERFSGTVLVVKGTRPIVSLAVGLADRGFAVPNRLDTKFNLASMNKMFTAVAIAQLVERGKLAFTDSLAKVLPDYPDRAFAERATIHHLLTHTSGIGGDINAPQMYEHRDRFKRPGDYLPLFAKEKPAFPPGERFSYANAGFVVLGAVIERVSGEDYFDYVQNHIFAASGMKGTSSYEIDEAVPNCAVGYRYDDGDPFGLMPLRTNMMTLAFKGTPAGGGYSTAPDLLAFTQALRAHKLLGAAMTETVTSGKVDAPGSWGPSERYGYGFMNRIANGKQVRGHGGMDLGVHTSLIAFWDGSYTVITLSNVLPPREDSHFANEIVDLLAAQIAG
jgi:CubicO group peptidase (beta-lactamase class C family)